MSKRSAIERNGVYKTVVQVAKYIGSGRKHGSAASNGKIAYNQSAPTNVAGGGKFQGSVGHGGAALVRFGIFEGDFPGTALFKRPVASHRIIEGEVVGPVDRKHRLIGHADVGPANRSTRGAVTHHHGPAAHTNFSVVRVHRHGKRSGSGF